MLGAKTSHTSCATGIQICRVLSKTFQRGLNICGMTTIWITGITIICERIKKHNSTLFNIDL